MDMQINIHTYVCTYIYARMYTYICTYTYFAGSLLHIHIHTRHGSLWTSRGRCRVGISLVPSLCLSNPCFYSKVDVAAASPCGRWDFGPHTSLSLLPAFFPSVCLSAIHGSETRLAFSLPFSSPSFMKMILKRAKVQACSAYAI